MHPLLFSTTVKNRDLGRRENHTTRVNCDNFFLDKHFRNRLDLSSCALFWKCEICRVSICLQNCLFVCLFVCLFLWTPLLSINENPYCDVASRLGANVLDPGRKWSLNDLLISYWLLQDCTLVILAIQLFMLKRYRCSFLWSEFSSV